MGPVKRNGVLERPAPWNKAALSARVLLRMSFMADSALAFPRLHEIAQSSGPFFGPFKPLWWQLLAWKGSSWS